VRAAEGRRQGLITGRRWKRLGWGPRLPDFLRYNDLEDLLEVSRHQKEKMPKKKK